MIRRMDQGGNDERTAGGYRRSGERRITLKRETKTGSGYVGKKENGEKAVGVIFCRKKKIPAKPIRKD